MQQVVPRPFEEEDRFFRRQARLGRIRLGEFLTHEGVGERLRRFLYP